MAAKKLELITTEEGCIVTISHSLNSDGYFRKRIDGRLMMYHRYMWEQREGLIPDGYEVDHKCKNRACCNTEHLQLLTSTDHRAKDNSERYSGRNKEAYEHWLVHNNTCTSLAEQFNVSFGTACRWIREWNK